MFHRSFWSIPLCLVLAAPLSAQLSQEARVNLIRGITAEQAAAQIDMPLGADGVQLSDAGDVNTDDLQKQLKKNGRSITTGKVVTVTALVMGDRAIEIELDGGGKSKRSIFDHLSVGMGPVGTPNSGNSPNSPNGPSSGSPNDKSKSPRGSKVTLKFAQKVPSDLTPDRLKELLKPVLDFTRTNFLRSGIDSLPPEFQEAVKAKEARIGMDRSTVIMALGSPDERVRETKDGVEMEDWIYHPRGKRTIFVTLDLAQNVVVSVREY
jgi:hypothetical protein